MGRLDPDQQQRCRELSIFREDDRVPLAAVRMLWAGSAGLSAVDSSLVLGRLSALSLLTVHEERTCACTMSCGHAFDRNWRVMPSPHCMQAC